MAVNLNYVWDGSKWVKQTAGGGGGGGGGGDASAANQTTMIGHLGAIASAAAPSASVNAVRVSVGTSSAVLIAARPARKTLMISNPQTNIAPIAISTGTADLVTSTNLNPGDSIRMETSAAMNAIASAVCAVDVVEVY